jgi:hypothetical protein
MQNEVFPASVFIADKTPVNSEQKIEEEHECSEKMQESHGSEPVTEGRFSALLDRRRAPDEVSCNSKRADDKRVLPMLQPHGKLPHVDTFDRIADHCSLLKSVVPALVSQGRHLLSMC